MERRTLAEIPKSIEKLMTPEAQRIAIAEACGWTRSHKGWWSHPTLPDNGGAEPEPPDYLYDLNAMHEAEKTMPDTVHRAYFYRLADGNSPWHYRMASMAPASKRAEMYLKTIGKWTDE